MRIPVVFALSALALWPQTPAPVPDTQVVATMDGAKLTAAGLRELLTGAPDLAIRSAGSDPREFLVSHLLLRRMSADALKSGIAKKSPYKDQLAWTRMQVLQAAMFSEKTREFRISEADADAYYKENPHLFGTAKVRMIFLAGDTPAVRARAAALLKQARAGADFAKLATLNSDDPDGRIDGGRMSDVVPESPLPAEIRKKLFASGPGTVALIPHEGEQYLFKVEDIVMKPEIEAKDRATGELVKVKMDAWVESLRKTAEVKIEHPAFFKSLPQTSGMYASEYKGPKPDEIKEDTLLAVINGKPMTAEDFTGLIKGVSPQVRTNAVRAPEAFLEQYALLRRITELAEKAGLPDRQPYANQIRYNDERILSQANVDDHLNNISIGPDEQRKAYDDNLNRFRFANLRVLYVPFSAAPPPPGDPNAPRVLSEPEARARIDEILAQLRAGKSFEDMVTVHSQDQESRGRQGLIPPVGAEDARIPENVRKLVFSTSPGEVAAPLRLANGYWLFKIEGHGSKTYEEVKDSVYEELRQARFDEWFNGVRSAFQVTIDDADGFRRIVEEAGAAAAARRG